MQNRKKYIDIGDVFFFEGNTEIWTVLGSCVSILLYSVNQRCGVICHAQLPEPSKIDCSQTNCNNCAYKSQHIENRFLRCAFREMLNILEKKQIARSSIEACVFGGANVLQGLSSQKPTIGERNSTLALELLKKNNIRIVEQAIGGTSGYKIIYDNSLRSVTVQRTLSSVFV